MFFNSEKLKELIAEHGIENCSFMVRMRPLRSDMLGIFKYTSSEDATQMVECKISEERYKLDENYKITLKPVDEGFATEHFYVMDLTSLIRDGQVEVHANGSKLH